MINDKQLLGVLEAAAAESYELMSSDTYVRFLTNNTVLAGHVALTRADRSAGRRQYSACVLQIRQLHVFLLFFVFIKTENIKELLRNATIQQLWTCPEDAKEKARIAEKKKASKESVKPSCDDTYLGRF